MKKVLVVNRGRCDNLGDQAINESMSSFIKSVYSYDVIFSEFTTLALKPKLIKLDVKSPRFKEHTRNFLKKILPLKFLWLIRNSSRVRSAVSSKNDLIVVGGGQLILSNSSFDIAAATWVFFARWYKKKIVFCAVGAGISFSFVNKIFFHYALKNCNGVCVRDASSKDTLKTIFNINSFVAGDIVFTDELFRSSTKGVVYLGIPALSVFQTYNEKVTRDEYYDIWLDFILKKDVNIGNCTLFFTTNEDYYESVKFSLFLKINHNIDIEIAQTNSLITLKHYMKDAKLVISGRMHALIIAANYSTDIIVFPISNKLLDFQEMLEESSLELVDYKKTIKSKVEFFLNSWL